jgi:diaminopimelate epimerase
VLLDEISPALAQRLGPQLERDPRFPARTNVQLVEVLARHRIRLELWERGAGYTLASGSSTCAAAAAALRAGLCDADVEARMPGGSLAVRVGPLFELTLEGPAQRVFEGVIALARSPT